jgi:MOSC domain-containing protein YiiM
MDHIGQEFRIDGVLMRGVKYCDPCMRPSRLSGNPKPFRETFWDRGGLVAEILEGGLIKVGSIIIPRTKDY